MWVGTSVHHVLMEHDEAWQHGPAIEIEDTCGGIPESAGDLFHPFGERRAKNRTGLGLGLSIARRAVRAQGGEIEVRNTPGKGCTFVIAVPAGAERVASDVVGEPAS